MMTSFASGFATSAALIVAIGAQNGFVLRQGLKREHVLPVVLVCALSDMLLIGLGVSGFGALVQSNAALLTLARWGGALFLIGYGLLAARRALTSQAMAMDGPGEAVASGPAVASLALAGPGPATAAVAPDNSLRAAVLACLAFTYLNPHCWLDTVVLLGAVAAQQPEGARASFGVGAASASAVWFFALGYGARLLAPLFAKPVAWRVLDGAIAAVMWTMAGMLLSGT
jgi:L-lysine exporter family protein LysE/ArgO